MRFHWIRKEFISPQGYSYGYNVKELAAVRYLLPEYPKWRPAYNPFGNHWAAMTVVAKDLSKACGLVVFADRIWAGGGWIGLGIVFMGNSMGVENRTPEADWKLRRLEQKLKELELVSTSKLEILCSGSYRHHFNEPFHIGLLPPPKTFSTKDMVELVKYWRGQSE